MVELNDIALKNVNLNDEEQDADEIPAYTEIHLTNHKIKEIITEKYAARRVLKLFISHLLDTKMVKTHDKLEKHFVINGVTFRTIMIRGVVVGLQYFSFKTKERMLIFVDDGTGVMDCYAEENKFLESTRNDVYGNLQNTKEMFEATRLNNVMLKGALMMLQSSNEQINKLPHYKNFQRGDTVVLIGSLSEYCDKRSCFISSILKDDSSNNTHYLEHLQNLYNTMYF